MALLHSKIAQKKNTAAPVMYKTITFNIADVKSISVTGRTVTGYLAAFNNKDGDGDILIKGCFAKSLAERGVNHTGGNSIAHLWQHKMDMPLGKYKVLQEDDYGLYFECEYDDIQKANDALIQFKSGTLKNFSIGYCYVWDKMEYMDYCAKDSLIVTPGNCCPQCGAKQSELSYCFVIRELDLFEGSVVTLAANENALFTGIKSAEDFNNEIDILTEEANELISTLKPRKRFELGQIISKYKALYQLKPSLESKEALKQKADLEAEEQRKLLEAKNKEDEAAKVPKRKFGKLSELVK